MLPFFNQKELVVARINLNTKNTHRFRKGRNNLSNKSTRFIITVSVFNGEPRERAGTAFQKVNYQMLYTIYVRKSDYERAVHVILA